MRVEPQSEPSAQWQHINLQKPKIRFPLFPRAQRRESKERGVGV